MDRSHINVSVIDWNKFSFSASVQGAGMLYEAGR